MIWESLTFGDKGHSVQQPLRENPKLQNSSGEVSGIAKSLLLHNTLSLGPKILETRLNTLDFSKLQ